MDLVGQHPDRAESQPEYRDDALSDRLEWKNEQSKQHRNRDKGDIAVGVDEAASQEIIRIDVMHAERHEEAVADDWQIVSPPRIGRPVNEAGREVGGRYSAKEPHWNPPLQKIYSESDPDAECEQQRHSRDNRDGREQKLRARQLVVANFHIGFMSYRVLMSSPAEADSSRHARM
jgi:hypothetical protein